MEPTAKKLASLPLTEWSALMLCMEHWNYISEYFINNESISFHGTIKWLILQSMQIERMQDYCACCEFVSQNNRSCDICLLWKYPKTCSYGEYGIFKKNPCKETALSIAYLAEEALDRIENDK